MRSLPTGRQAFTNRKVGMTFFIVELSMFSFLITIIVIFVAAWSIRLIRSFAPWVPTRKKDLARIAALADLSPMETFVDLGCGDGRVCFALAENDPHAHIRGVELSVFWYMWCQTRLFFHPQKNLTFHLADMYHHDISDVDVLFLFGVSETMSGPVCEKIIPKMKNAARVISYNFAIKGWHGDVLESKPTETSTMIRVYTI